MAFCNDASTALRQHTSNPSLFTTDRPFSSRLLSTQTSQQETKDGRIPVNLLAGFLGSGKTSTLLNLLTNKDGIRIGVVVNDVASVNIDQKLIANPSNTDGDGNVLLSSADTVELQNGCACCSLADELMDSIAQLTANLDERPLDAIVVELSGVADPNAVFQNFEMAEARDHPATLKSKMGSIVTLIDSCTFGSDYMTYDKFGDRDGWVEEGDDCSAEMKVPELLAEQVEAANVLLVNKIDMADEKEVETTMKVARALNKDAALYQVEFGKVGLEKILGEEFKKEEEKCTDPGCSDPGCSDHTCADDKVEEEKCENTACSDPGCVDPTCADDKEEEKCKNSACSDPGCVDPTCSDKEEEKCEDLGCSDPGCSDPTCADKEAVKPSPPRKKKITTMDLGITNFVYRSPKPFNTMRLMALLNLWPVPIKDTLDLDSLAKAATGRYIADDPKVAEKCPFTGVLRSKGFCWIAPSVWNGGGEDSWRHDTAMFWSNAGKHFGISTAGKWWGTITKEQMKSSFPNNMKEYERILNEDWASEEWGDRRQELVFIGVKINEAEIRGALDECLLTEEEMAVYRQQVRNIREKAFTTTAWTADGPSLFDLTGNDHIDVNSDVNIRGD